jgi:hypothetical protein
MPILDLLASMYAPTHAAGAGRHVAARGSAAGAPQHSGRVHGIPGAFVLQWKVQLFKDQCFPSVLCELSQHIITRRFPLCTRPTHSSVINHDVISGYWFFAPTIRAHAGHARGSAGVQENGACRRRAGGDLHFSFAPPHPTPHQVSCL